MKNKIDKISTSHEKTQISFINTEENELMHKPKSNIFKNKKKSKHN